jgi:hypothetical protein
MNSLAKFLLSVIAILASAQQDFPDTGFAVLGIGGTGASDRAGVEVVVLRSGGPAERSGIQVGDIVVAMGGLPVISYEELMDLVSRRAPGDSVSIEIEREGKRVALRLALLDARKVCNEGNGWACSVLALRYDDGDVFEEDQHKASLFFERGCEHGYIPACGLLANKYKYGEGVSKDLVRAAELFRRTCVAEYAYACLYLGEAYESPRTGRLLRSFTARPVTVVGTWAVRNGGMSPAAVRAKCANLKRFPSQRRSSTLPWSKP